MSSYDDKIADLEIRVRDLEETLGNQRLENRIGYSAQFKQLESAVEQDNFKVVWRATDELKGPRVLAPDGVTKVALFGFMISPRISGFFGTNWPSGPKSLYEKIRGIVDAESLKLFDADISIPDGKGFRETNRSGHTCIFGARTANDLNWWAIDFSHHWPGTSLDRRISDWHHVGAHFDSFHGFHNDTLVMQGDEGNFVVDVRAADADDELGVHLAHIKIRRR